MSLWEDSRSSRAISYETEYSYNGYQDSALRFPGPLEGVAFALLCCESDLHVAMQILQGRPNTQPPTAIEVQVVKKSFPKGCGRMAAENSPPATVALLLIVAVPYATFEQ